MKLALGAFLLVASAGRAAAQPVDHATLGVEAFADGRLDDALRELEAAYREEPDANLLFALGRVHSARGDCPRAIDHYRRYLASEPGQKGAEAAQVEIDKCQAVAPDVVRPPDEDTGPAVATPDAPPPARAARHGFTGSMIRDHFVQAGLVTGVLTGAVYLYARSNACWDGVCSPDEVDDYDDYQRRHDRVTLLNVATGVMGGVAAGLVVTGAVRYAMRDDDADRFEASVAPRRGGGTIMVSGRF